MQVVLFFLKTNRGRDSLKPILVV